MKGPGDRDDDALFAELAALGDEPLPGEASDAAIVADALAAAPLAPVELAFDDPAPAPAAAPEPGDAMPRGRLVLMMVGVAMASAAAVVLLLGLPGLRLGERDDDGPGSLSPSVHEVDDAGQLREAGERTPEPATRRRRAAASDDEVPSEEAVEREPIVEEDPDGAQLELSDEAEEAIAADGGDERGRRAPVVLPRTPDGLLSHAQTQLQEGHKLLALRTYKRLVERFPDSREAKTALVSMGRLELSRGKAKRALAHFDAYLAASAGALVEEARYGRIRALRMLGRSGQELRSIEAFLVDHGDSIYAPRLRKRAEELTKE